MKKSLAVVTMCYNEKRNLRRWIEYYSRQVGNFCDLHVVDHGSNDGSTEGLECVVHNLNRDAGGDRLQNWRAGFISDYCNDLLEGYDRVLYTDADEIVVADPHRFRDLADFARSDSCCNATFGYDVLHDVRFEPKLAAGPILSQRTKLLFVAAMCKPSLISSPTRFVPGFHCSTNEPIFGDLYRFHLRYSDIDTGLERLAITRALDRPEMRTVPVDHQQISDERYKDWVSTWVSYPMTDDPIGRGNLDIENFLSSLNISQSNSGYFMFNYGFRSSRLVRVPEIFRTVV